MANKLLYEPRSPRGDHGKLVIDNSICAIVNIDNQLYLLNKKYSMIIPDENIILYINEGFAPTSIINIGEGRAKNLIQEAYDIVDRKKFLAMVFDIIGEDIND